MEIDSRKPILVTQWPDDEMFIFERGRGCKNRGRSSHRAQQHDRERPPPPYRPYTAPSTKTTTLTLGNVSNQVGRETILNQTTMKENLQVSKSMTEVLPLKYDNHKAALVPFSPGMHVLQPVHGVVFPTDCYKSFLLHIRNNTRTNFWELVNRITI